jgi:nucleotide-binding universal stress UspA family protein
MIKRILVSVDGSEPSGKALVLAANIAEKYDANVYAIFVASPEIEEELQHFKNHEYPLKDGNAANAVCEQMGRNTINGMVGKLKTKVVIKPVVRFGNPAARIVEYSMINNVDMVVMGNRGLSDIKGMMMGSVSRKVHRQVRCPFVSVK